MGKKLGALFGGDGREGAGCSIFPLFPTASFSWNQGSFGEESGLSGALTHSLPPCRVEEHLRSVPPSDFLHRGAAALPERGALREPGTAGLWLPLLARSVGNSSGASPAPSPPLAAFPELFGLFLLQGKVRAPRRRGILAALLHCLCGPPQLQPQLREEQELALAMAHCEWARGPLCALLDLILSPYGHRSRWEPSGSTALLPLSRGNHLVPWCVGIAHTEKLWACGFGGQVAFSGH